MARDGIGPSQRCLIPLSGSVYRVRTTYEIWWLGAESDQSLGCAILPNHSVHPLDDDTANDSRSETRAGALEANRKGDLIKAPFGNQ